MGLVSSLVSVSDADPLAASAVSVAESDAGVEVVYDSVGKETWDESLASVRDIEINFTAPEDPLTIFIDREKYEKIVINLISNAKDALEETKKASITIKMENDSESSGFIKIFITIVFNK